MAEDTEELSCVIRSCLVSSSTILKASQLKYDCEEWLGKEFPLRKLGFRTFVEYLASIPSVVRLVPPNSSNPDVHPIQSEKSRHVDELIQRQRKPVSKSRYAPPLRKRPAAITNGFSRQQSGRNSYNSNSLPNNNISRSNSYSSVRPNTISDYPPTRSTSTFENLSVKSPSPPIPKGLFVSDIERNMRRQYDEKSLRENGLHSGEDLLNHATDLVKRVGAKVYANYESSVVSPYSTNSLETQRQTPYSSYGVLEKEQSTAYSNEVLETRESTVYSNKVLETKESTPYPNNTTNGTDALDDYDYEDYLLEGSNDFDENMSEEEIFNETMRRYTQSQAFGDSDHHKYGYQSEAYESNISEAMIKNFRTIINQYPAGIWAVELPKKYLELTGAKLDYTDLGFSSIIDLVSTVSHVFHLNREGTNDWKLYDARLPAKNIVAPEIELPEFSQTERYVPHSILQDIEQLMDDHPRGFRSTYLQEYYKQKYNKPLDLEALGFNQFDDFVEILKSVVRVTPTMGYYFLQKKLKCIKITRENNQEVLTLPESEMKHIVPKDTLTPSDEIPLQELPPINQNCAENEPLLELTLRVGEVISPAYFFVILQDKYSALEIMMEEMVGFYNNEETNYHVPELYVKPGLFCVAMYFASKEWHRAKITNVISMNQIEVEYVDYGTPGKVTKNDLRLLHKDWAKLPTQAICARLLGVKPLNKGKRYSKTACNKFLEIVSDKVLWAYVYACNTNKKKVRLQLDLVLFDTHGPKEEVCSKLLIDKKLAEYANMDEDIPSESELDQHLPQGELPQWSQAEKCEETNPIKSQAESCQETKPIKKPPPGFESCAPEKPASLNSPKSCHSTPEPTTSFPTPDSTFQEAQLVNAIRQLLSVSDASSIVENVVRAGVYHPNVAFNSQAYTAPSQQYHGQNYYPMQMTNEYGQVYQTLPTNYGYPNQHFISYPQQINYQQPPLMLTPPNLNYNYCNYPAAPNNVHYVNVIEPRRGMPINYYANTTHTAMGNQQNMRMPFNPNMTRVGPASSSFTSRPGPTHNNKPTPSALASSNHAKTSLVPNPLDLCSNLSIKEVPDLSAIKMIPSLASTTCNAAKTHTGDKMPISQNQLPNIAEHPTSAVPKLSPTSVEAGGIIPQSLEDKLPISLNPMPLEISEHPTSAVPKLSPTSVEVGGIIPQSLEDKLPISLNPMPLEISEHPPSAVPELSPTSVEVAGLNPLPLEVDKLNLPLPAEDQIHDSGRLSVPISVSSLDSNTSRHKAVFCTSDEYLSASESVEDNDKCMLNKDAVESSPEKIKNIFDDDIPDCWEDIDSQPLMASNFDEDFKVPFELLIGDFNDNSIKIENVFEDSTLNPPLNWSDMYPDILHNKCKRVDEPDVTKTSRPMENIASIKTTLVQKLEIDSICFHLIYVQDKLAVLAREFYPQFSNLTVTALEKILETIRPFTSISKSNQPALFTALDKVEFCGGVDKKTVIRFGKLVAVSFLEDVPELLRQLNVRNKVLLDKIKEISSQESNSL